MGYKSSYYEDMKNSENSLQWKDHSGFFSSLNNKLDEISNIGEECYRDVNKLYDYYGKIKNLFNKHYAYILDPEKMKRELAIVQKALYDKEFLKSVQDNIGSAKEHQIKIFDKMQDILTEMILNFTYPELIPKPIKRGTLMSLSEDLSEEERLEYDALEEIGVKYSIL